MITTKKTEITIGWILTFGTLISAFVMIIGGVSFLWQNGLHTIQAELAHGTPLTSLAHVIHSVSILAPRGIIALGALLLVATQLLRVALLVGFYAAIRDYAFTGISLFILIVLLITFFVW